jgi:translocator protein
VLDLFLTFLAASVAAAATGMIFKPGEWYDSLKKPTWVPPRWMFPVVWTILYVLSAWAATRIAVKPANAQAIAFWALQIALNTLWTPVFFGAKRMGLAMAVIGALWLTVAAMLVAFWQLDALAAVLILPYLAWLTVAAALNWRVWRDNRGTTA